MTVHDHRFTEPTPPFDLSGENDPEWDELWQGYGAWLAETERELETGDAR